MSYDLDVSGVPWRDFMQPDATGEEEKKETKRLGALENPEETDQSNPTDSYRPTGPDMSGYTWESQLLPEHPSWEGGGGAFTSTENATPSD